MSKTQPIQPDKYRLVVENTTDGIYIISSKGFLYVNPAFEQITGFSAAEMCQPDFNFMNVVHPDDASLIQSMKTDRESGIRSSLIYSFRIKDKAGEIKHLEVSTNRLPGATIQIIGIVRDITTRLSAEVAQQRTQANLEQMVADRTQELELRIAQSENLNHATVNLMADLRASQKGLQKSQEALIAAHQMLQEDQIKERATLLRLSQAIMAENDSKTILNIAVHEAANALESEFAASVLIDENQTHFSSEAWYGWSEEMRTSIQNIPINENTAMGRVLSAKVPVITANIAFSEHKSPKIFCKMGIKARLIVPMLVGDEAIGGLAVQEKVLRQWTEDEVRLLSLIANTTAQALVRARLFEQVQNGRDRLNLLSRRLVEVQESERHLIARELHDQVGQNITALKLHLQMLTYNSSDEELQSGLAESIEMAERSLQRVRNLSRDLRPSVLDDFGLEPALRWLLDRQAQWAGFKVKFLSDLPPERLPPDTETVCYRIAQGALTNIGQHAAAKKVTMHVWITPSTLHLEIKDNGQGFDVTAALDQASQGKSLGLFSMIERAELLGGQVTIESTPGQGTHITGQLPLEINQSIERRNSKRTSK
jgi:PAS domain S-box-containing protein